LEGDEMTRARVFRWWAPRFWTTALVVVMLCLCALVLSETELFQELVHAMAAGRGIDPGLISVLLLLPIVALSAFIAIGFGKGMKATLAVSWAMIVPAILSFSSIDWLTIFSPAGSGGHLMVALPDYLVMAIAIALSAACLCQRSYAQVVTIRERLRSRGIDGFEVDAATAEMFVSMSALALAAGLAAVAVLAAGSMLSTLNRPNPMLFAAGIGVVFLAVAALFLVLRRLERVKTSIA